MSDPITKQYEADKMRRNLNPHAPARVAMVLYNERYAAQRGGSMDFWDSLREGERDTCRKIAQEIKDAPQEAREG